MTPDRYRQAAEIYHAVLEVEPGKRAAFLQDRCGNDEELRREVGSLLAAHEQAGSFISVNALEDRAKLSSDKTMVGEVVSHYRIVEKLGEGGMGVVYRAEDTLLRRAVALKFLPARLSGNPELRSRLIREARAAAALSHPNICTIFEINQTDAGAPFIAMELVRGETLTSVIARSGQLPLKQVVHVAVQVADALAEAHSRGIVHRDLKPQNVMISSDGQVLDFGLAKFLELAAESEDAIQQTASGDLTAQGRIIGTPAYMSPEQVLGRTLDNRSDVFSFGIMLYQMTAGKLPFEGPTVTATLAKILESEPVPASVIRSALPSDLERIIQRCLRKEPKERFNDTRDLALDVSELQKSITSNSSDTRHPKNLHGPAQAVFRQRRLTLVLAAVLLAILAAVIGFFQFGNSKLRSPIPPVRKQVTFTGHSSYPAISPDGQFLAYADDTGVPGKVMVQDLSGGAPVQVFEAEFLMRPQWSPDGSRLLVGGGFNRSVGGVVPRLGGKIQQLPIFDYWSWSPDGKQYAGVGEASTALSLVDVATGNVKKVPLSRNGVLWWRGLDWSSRGNVLALASVDENSRGAIWTVRSDGTEQQKLYQSEEGLTSPKWSSDGNAIYFLVSSVCGELSNNGLCFSTGLWKLPVSLSPRVSVREPVLVMTGLQAGDSFSVTRDGRRIAIGNVIAQSNLWLVERIDTGELRNRQLTQGTALNNSPSFSPDGNQIAFVRGDTRVSNIFTMPIQGGEPRQITFLNSVTGGPAWSADGTRIAFASLEGGSLRLWRVPSMGGQSLLSDIQLGSFDLSWAPSSSIAFQRPGNRNIGLFDPNSEEQTNLLVDGSQGWVFLPRFSRDVRQVLVYWNQMGTSVGLWRMSLDGSAHPRAVPLTGRQRVTLSQSIDAAPYRNRQIQLRGAIKAHMSGTDRAGCFLVVRKRDEPKLPERAIAQLPQWQNCKAIESRVDSDAEKIIFGGFLNGSGAVWMDDFKLAFRDDNNQWQPIQLVNPSFEEAERDTPTGWSIEPDEHSVKAAVDAYDGKRSAFIENRPKFSLSQGFFVPIGWSADATMAYALDVDSRNIVVIPRSGGPAKTLFALPWPKDLNVSWIVAMSPDARRFVFSVGQSQEDAWIIHNFDPHVR
jgi:eukaryotic-like serine/threonine-protein kinase